MTGRIVDTNVWIVASGGGEDCWMSEDCVESCLQWMSEFRDSKEPLIVDASSFGEGNVPGTTVIKELRNNLTQGSFGHDLLNRHFMQDFLFELIEIEYDSEGANLPHHLQLPGFEPADRKWVALHINHPARPPIHNAADGDWIKQKSHLKTAGIVVVNLCEAELKKRVLDREQGKKTKSRSEKTGEKAAISRKKKSLKPATEGQQK
jgi:hypothetical protein